MAVPYFQPWPPPPSAPFPESQRDSTGTRKPDFPGSAGDREQGKFRPSRTPRLVTLAVVNDDGTKIGEIEARSEEEQVLLLRAIVLGLSMMTETDLLSEVSGS